MHSEYCKKIFTDKTRLNIYMGKSKKNLLNVFVVYKDK